MNRANTLMQFSVLLKNTYRHLQENRFELALQNAKSLYDIEPNNTEVLIALAWAHLENHFPTEALEFANLAVQNNDKVFTEARLYRGFILMRLGIYDSALVDIESTIKNREGSINWALEIKAKSLAGLNRFGDAYKVFENLCKIDKDLVKESPFLREWYREAAGLKNTFLNKLLTQDKPSLEIAEQAYNVKELWYSLRVCYKLLEDDSFSELVPQIKLIQFYVYFDLFQYKPALNIGEEIFTTFEGTLSFIDKYNKLKDILSRADKTELGTITKIEQEITSPQIIQEPEVISETPNDETTKDIKLSPIDSPDILRLNNYEYVSEDNAPPSETPEIAVHDNSLPADVFSLPKSQNSINEAEVKPASRFTIISSIDEEVDEIITPENIEVVAPKVTNTPPTPIKKTELTKKTEFIGYEGSPFKVYNTRVFDLVSNINSKDKTFILQFPESSIKFIGAEIVMSNPFNNREDISVDGTALWYLNDTLIGQNDFILDISSAWRYVVFMQSWGTESNGYWKSGQAKFEIILGGKKVAEKYFLIGNTSILDLDTFDLSDIEENHTMELISKQIIENSKSNLSADGNQKTLEDSLKELESFTGLEAVKKGMRDFVDYLTFIKERKKLGLKTKDGISVNSVFLGNPGTGKTTIARILGNIFKNMGILSKGHLVETDRSGLVGQYIGETAQKTETIINEAMGGLLFIDEAYTLVKKSSSGQDFGQEAIDTLMKRMEDKSGEFVVIVAGYPDEMNAFLESNPGMKSRFNHFFNFEDYTPDELLTIFTQMAKKEDYNLPDEAAEQLKKEFTTLYRKRDKTFGNARLVRNTFEEAKLQLSKRYLKLPDNSRDSKALTTFDISDFISAFKKEESKNYNLNIDEEKLKINLDKLNGLMGLSEVKKEVLELVKLVRFFNEQGMDVNNRFSDHIVFTGNPGTGKTTVARIISEIYSALGILPKGHLVEADRQLLVASYIGKTAEKTTEVINSSIGGTLFIDEAYTLVKKGDSGSDFGTEAIDTLLKRMEDERGKFIVIAAGYTEEMKRFLDSNPGLQSRFTKFINFDDYTPDELLTITTNILSSKELSLSDEAKDLLVIHYNELYRNRDNTFSNARLARNISDTIAKNQLLRIADIPKELRTDDLAKTINSEDVREIVSKKVAKTVIQVQGNKELLEKHLAELSSLTGLQSVKKSVDKLISSLKIAQVRRERGLKVIPKSLHGVFMGNPGTGKTTIARLISSIYKEMGLLTKGHLVEVDRSSLVAGYVGQTAKKTDEIIQSALGGTLFIDEAYTLSRGGNDFGQEAIDTLLKRMEDYKEELVVIVAGYPNEMKSFLNSNPGLESRFTNHFMFDDYSPEEMLLIAESLAIKSGYKLDDSAKSDLLTHFTTLYSKRDKAFGNARTVRNILYKAISNQEERILTLTDFTDEDLVKLIKEDVQNL